MARSSASAILALCLLSAVAQAQSSASAQIVLRWKEVADAADYELEIAKDAAFKDVVLREKTPTAGFRWKEIPTIAYYWRVRSLDTSGRQSPWSEASIIEAAVSAPALLRPPPGARLPMAEPRPVELAFQISQVLQGYRVEVASDARFSKRLLERSVTGAPVFFIAPAPGTYFWRVSATDLKGRNTGFGEVRTFQVMIAPPRLLAPADGVSFSWGERLTPVELKWSVGWGVVRYLVEVQAPGAPVVKTASKRPALTVPLSGAGRSEWRVRAEDASGALSDWARASFTLTPEVELPKAAPLAAPTLSAPAALAVLPRTPQLQLSWAAVPMAARYEAQLAATGESLEASAPRPVTGTSLTWAAELGEYTWRVRALAEDGAPGPWSLTSSFQVVLPASVRAEIASSQTSLVADGSSSTELHVRLFDAAGAPVRGAPVRIEVNAGAVDPVVESADGYRARYVSPASAPAEGSARVLVKDRDFEQASSVPLVRKLERFALGARAGFNGNFSGPSSPQGGLELRYRTPLFGDRLGLSLRGGFHAASTQASVPSVAEPVAINALLFSGALLALLEFPFQQVRFLVGVGPTVCLARITAGVERETRVVPGVQGLVGAGLRLGHFELVAEAGYSHGRIDDEGAVLGTGGLFVSVGVLFWLP